MTQLELYKEALRLLRDSEVPSYWPSFMTGELNHGTYYFSGLCDLLDMINYENGRDMDASDMLFKTQSEDILGMKLEWQSFWFTPLYLNKELAKQERIQHLENLIKLYEKN